MRPHGLYSPWNSPGQNTGVGSRSFPQGIFPLQGSNPGLLHCRQSLYHLSHQKKGTCSCFIYLPELLLRVTPCPRLTIPGRILNMKSTDSWGKVFSNSFPINLMQSGAFLFSNSAICSSPFPTHFGLIP